MVSLLAASLLPLVATLPGCGTPAPSIKIDGSSTVYPISEAVAEEFCRDGGRVNVTVGKSGTGGGMKKFYAGEIDIADASRPMKPAEQEKCAAAGLDYVELSVAFDGIAIIVHPDNDWCRELSVEQLASIWRPDQPVQKWSELNPDWPDAKIHLYGPGTASGTFDYFTEEIVGKSGACRPDYTASEDDNVLVTGVSRDKNSLGYFGFAYYEENKGKLGVVAVRPDEASEAVRPSLETIRSNAYRPLSRPLLVYVGLPVLDRPIGAEFARYYLDKASELASEVGYVPVSDAVAAENDVRLSAAIAAANAGDNAQAPDEMAETASSGPGAAGTASAGSLVALGVLLTLLAAGALAYQRSPELAIQGFLALCAAVSVLTTVGIVAVLLGESLPFFREVSVFEFLTSTQWTPLFDPPNFGVLPLLCGTLLVTGGAICVAGPIGLGAAIYLSEYARPAVREVVKPILEVLAGIPSVVYGVVAVTTVSPAVQRLFGSESIFNALSASIVVGFMILPMIVSLSEDVLRSVPRDLRSAAYALGATKLDVTTRVIVPAALSGIVAAVLLAISRAIGETMAVTLAAGATPNLTLNPLESVQTMTAYIVQVSKGDTPAGSLEYRTIFAVGLTLFISTMILNIIAQQVLKRMREQYE